MTGKISKIARQKKNPHRYAVYIDGEYAFGLDEEILIKRKIAVDRELSGREIETLNCEDELFRAKAKAFELLSYRDHSTQELSLKLRKRGFSQDAIAWLIEEISRLKLLDDTSFAIAFARGKIRRKPMGRRGLAQQLKQKGLSDSILHQTLDLIYSEFDEQAMARDLAEKKMLAMTEKDPVLQKKKLNDFLYRRGFAWDVIEPIFSAITSAAASSNQPFESDALS